MTAISISSELSKFANIFTQALPGQTDMAIKPAVISRDGFYQLAITHPVTINLPKTPLKLTEQQSSDLLTFCAYRFLESDLARFTTYQANLIRFIVREFNDRLSPLVLAYSQSFTVLENNLKFGDMRDNDLRVYGDNVLFHHKEKRGNKRFDVFLHEKNGEYIAIFRRAYAKRNAEGKNTTYVNAESIVRFTKDNFDKSKIFPAGMEFLGSILLSSDPIKNIGVK